jgi:hypothetical protein
MSEVNSGLATVLAWLRTRGVTVPMDKSGRDTDGRETVSAPGARSTAEVSAQPDERGVKGK